MNQNIALAKLHRIDALTGGDDQYRYLLYQLKLSMADATGIDLIVSFLMESGVRLLLEDLQSAIEKGIRVRILTGNYLGITQPSALYLIKQKMGDRVDLRFYNERERSFHPKAYFIHHSNYNELYIGSSNISRSALTQGIEWNYRLTDKVDPGSYDSFYSTFQDLFENHSILIDDKELKRYAEEWHQPAVAKDLAKYEQEQASVTDVHMIYEPRGAQIEALCALENSRAEGAKRALVYAATGIGKTYLAAFDSIGFKRVLFVAHRDEILKQAAASFRNVRPSDGIGFFDGRHKETNKPLTFASVSTLGRLEYLTDKFFSPDQFDYMVVDEFHHAVNDQYIRIINYFKPQFMLGLTATPERLDGRSIYELCDYNVPYELPLKNAINRGVLVPFHYYGIYDDTDYSGLHVVRGRYDEKELNETYIGNAHRHELIYKNYKKHPSMRALGFCCSRAHAEEMAGVFTRLGVPSVAVYSNADGEYSEERETAVSRLISGEIKVIFSVDMFNEGLDIPAVDMVMFLRPTESPTVFLQQLGRGLRKHNGKQFLTVLDFIGNYVKAGKTRFLLSDFSKVSGAHTPGDIPQDFPDDCFVDYDLRLIDLFHEMDRNSLRLRDKIRMEFDRVREVIQHRPSRMELFTYMDDDVYQLCIGHSAENPFRRYFDYIQGLGLLTGEEQKLYNGLGREFISILETTNMTRVYKMPVLKAIYNHGDVQMQVSEEQLLRHWKGFFGQNSNWKDLPHIGSYEDYLRISDRDHIRNILSNPVHFLKESGKGFFIEKDGYPIALRDDLKDVVQIPAFRDQMNDIIQYRIMDYYKRRYRES